MVTRNNISSYLLVVVAFVLATTVVVGSQCSPLFCEDVIKRLKIGRSGTLLFQGDIMLSIADYGMERSRRAALSSRERKWPNATIPYRFDEYIADNLRENFQLAMEEWENKSCITFIEQTTEEDYIILAQDESCRSYIGRVGGAQRVTIGNGCNLVGNAMHELGHVIGFGHEHSRPDRDHFISISWNSVQSPFCSNFCKFKLFQVDSLGSAYDYHSIMHYGSRAFSIDSQHTINPLNKSALAAIGQRVQLSTGDIQQVNRLYQCPTEAPTTPPTTPSATPHSVSTTNKNSTTSFSTTPSDIPPAPPTNHPASKPSVNWINGSYIVLRASSSLPEQYMACHIVLGRCYFVSCSCGQCGNDEFNITSLNSSQVHSGDHVTLHINKGGNPQFLACDVRGCSLQSSEVGVVRSCSSKEVYTLRSPDRIHGEVIQSGDQVTLHLCSNPNLSINCGRKRCILSSPVTFIIFNRSVCNQQH